MYSVPSIRKLFSVPSYYYYFPPICILCINLGTEYSRGLVRLQLLVRFFLEYSKKNEKEVSCSAGWTGPTGSGGSISSFVLGGLCISKLDRWMAALSTSFIYCVPSIITLRFFFRFRSRQLDSGFLQSHRVHGVCVRSTNGSTADGFPLDGDDSIRGSSNLFYILQILYLILYALFDVDQQSIHCENH